MFPEYDTFEKLMMNKSNHYSKSNISLKIADLKIEVPENFQF